MTPFQPTWPQKCHGTFFLAPNFRGQEKLFFSIILFIISSSLIANDLKFNIISFEQDFSEFLSKAKGKPFQAQVKIWEQVIESKNLDFYQRFSYWKGYDDKWQTKRKERLEEFIPWSILNSKGLITSKDRI